MSYWKELTVIQQIQKSMRSIKLLLWVFAAAAVIFTASCIKEPDRVDYTPEREQVIIKEFIDSLIAKGNSVDTSYYGMYYVILKEGTGEFIKFNDSIGVSYVGYFPETGYVFDASEFWYSGGIWKFRYQSSYLISGFDEALSLLNKSSEGLFLVPSDMAYGATGNGAIPPYSPLVFHIKIEDIYED